MALMTKLHKCCRPPPCLLLLNSDTCLSKLNRTSLVNAIRLEANCQYLVALQIHTISPGYEAKRHDGPAAAAKEKEEEHR